jgi:hypothetical protein
MSNHHFQNQHDLKTYGYRFFGDSTYSDLRAELIIQIQNYEDFADLEIVSWSTMDDEANSLKYWNLMKEILTLHEKKHELDLDKITKSGLDKLIRTGLFDQYSPKPLLQNTVAPDFITKQVASAYDLVKLARIELLVEIIERGNLKILPPDACYPLHCGLLLKWLAYLDNKNIDSASYDCPPYGDPFLDIFRWAEIEYQLSNIEASLLFGYFSNYTTQILTLNALKSGRRVGSLDPDSPENNVYILEPLKPDKHRGITIFTLFDKYAIHGLRQFLDLPENLEDLILEEYNSDPEKGNYEYEARNYRYEESGYCISDQALMKFGIPDPRLIQDD